MGNTGQLMPDMSNDEDKFEEEWLVVLSSKSEYTLSKNQAFVLRQEIASGNRATIMFETFAIPIPYIVEFYRVSRFLKEEYRRQPRLPERATEKLYQPVSPEKWAKFKEEVYKKIGG